MSSNTLRRTLQELKVGQPTDMDEAWRSYNLDDMDSARRSHLLMPYRLPSKEAARSMVKIYFSTVHVAYPFLSQEMFERLFSHLWDESGIHSLTDSWKATFCTFRVISLMIDMVFAWGAAYVSMSGESEGSTDDHFRYYDQARLYLGDVIDIFPPEMDTISCLLLVSLYLLMTHKPYRFNILKFVLIFL